MQKNLILKLVFGLAIFFFLVQIIVLIAHGKENVLLKSGDSFNQLFIDTVRNNLKFDYGYANPEDTLCSYTFKKEYKIVVWKISQYSDVDLDKTSITLAHNISNSYFIPYLYLDIIPELEIWKKSIKYKNPILNIKIKKRSKIYSKDIEGIYMLTDGFGLGYPKGKTHIIFDFNNKPKELNLILKKQREQLLIFILYPIEKKELGKNILKEMIRH